MTDKQPVALKLAEMLPANEWLGHETLVSYARECVAELLTQYARITELESQLAQRFDAADMATAAQAVVDRWDTPLWKDVPATADYIGRLRAALAAGQATAAPVQPAAQQGAAYAALPTSSHAGRVYEEGFLVGTCPLYTADKMRAFADATHTLRASHGQAPAETGNSVSAQAASEEKK